MVTPRRRPTLTRFGYRLRRRQQHRLIHTQARRRRLQQYLLRHRRRLWRAAILSATALVFLLILAAPFLKAHLQAIAVLKLFANEPVPVPLRWAVAEPVTISDQIIPTPSGPVRARLYTPRHHPNAPALIVLHGVHHLGMDEPRLIAFATAMSACGLRVLTPELPDIKDYHVGANSIATIGESALWFSRQTGNRPVGIMGLSFSGGLSLLAAADPQFRPAIKFVLAIGSQDSMARVASYYRTGEDQRPTGGEETLAPHEYGPLVLEYEHLADFVPARDLTALRAVLRAHLYEDVPGETAAMTRLTPAQQSEARALMDTGSPATRALLARAEARHIADMAGVSPEGHLKSLTTPVFLLHGEADNIIPSAETQWMIDELPSETLQAALISPVISHLDMNGAGPGTLDHLRLVHFFALVLHAAESP